MVSPIVVSDGVEDRWPPAHEQALYDMHAKYADVVDTDEVVAYLEGLPSQRRNAAAECSTLPPTCTAHSPRAKCRAKKNN